MTAIEAKAARLLAEGRVTPETAPTWTFHVEGDTGQYVTVVGAHVAICTCPSSKRCAHIEAAVAWVNATDAERALMIELREQRAAGRARAADEVFARLGA